MKQHDKSAARTDLEERTKAAFDASLSELNAHVRSRLTQARFAAVAEMERKSASPLRRVWMPAAGLAAAALIAVLIFVPGMNRAPRSDAALTDDDMPLLLDSDNVEFLEEMEFYAWLDEVALLDGEAGALEPTASRVAAPARS